LLYKSLPVGALLDSVDTGYAFSNCLLCREGDVLPLSIMALQKGQQGVFGRRGKITYIHV